MRNVGFPNDRPAQAAGRKLVDRPDRRDRDLSADRRAPAREGAVRAPRHHRDPAERVEAAPDRRRAVALGAVEADGRDEHDGHRDHQSNGRGRPGRTRAEHRGPPGVADPAVARGPRTREEGRCRAVGDPEGRGRRTRARRARAIDIDAREGRRPRRAERRRARRPRREDRKDSMSKVIVSCALTGAVTAKQLCSAIPYTPVEIAEEAKRAYDAGAAIVHVHARNDDGSPTWSKDTFAKIMAETKARCPVLINWSTGGAGPMSERVHHLAQRP